MPSKNDLSSLKVQSKNSLVEAQKELNNKQSSPAWRKPKPIMEKQSEIVGLRFTKLELEQIKKQAGLIPVATYLKNKLVSQTTLFR